MLAQRADKIVRQDITLVNVTTDFAHKALLPLCLRLGLNIILVIGVSHRFRIGNWGNRASMAHFINNYSIGTTVSVGGGWESTDDRNGTDLFDDADAKSLEFYKETGIDALAPAIGNAHRIYKQKPHLQLKHLGEISKIVPIPLVLHGGSGISDEDIKECIKNGISKVNINTDLQIAWAKGIRKFLQDNKDVYDPRKIILSGRENMINQIKHLVKTFNTKRVSDFSRNNTI